MVDDPVLVVEATTTDVALQIEAEESTLTGGIYRIARNFLRSKNISQMAHEFRG